MNIEGDLPPLWDKIDQLNDRAFEMRVSDSNRALSLSQEIVDQSRNLGYKKGLAYGLRTLGFCHMRISKNEDAMSYLEEALSLFDTLQDKFGKGHAAAIIGIVQRNFGNYQRSLEYLHQALEVVSYGLG